MNKTSKRTALSCAVTAAIAAGVSASPAVADDYTGDEGQYLSGDFHNHTTCSDGSTSVKTLVRESLTYLDWFIHVGHSGSGSRDCNVDDFIGINRSSGDNRGLWVNTVGVEAIKGNNLQTRTMANGDQVERMWRWQSLQEFNFDPIVEVRNDVPAIEKDQQAFLGLEWVVPGHEHSSNTIATGQYDLIPNADAIAQFEYCFARNSEDTSGGAGQGWTCEITAESNEFLKELFDGRPEEGNADYNATLVDGINTDDSGDHVKSVAAVLWAQENFPGDAFSVQAHIERQGAFLPGSNRGFNIEHLRDAHTAAPDISFGMETQPGHQAGYDRGTYSARRPSAGLVTYGGTGCYGAAEAAKPGLDFHGRPLDPVQLNIEYGTSLSVDLNRVTLCRPGIRTMWDAMLSEGRRFWFFASSDWHNRGAFGPLDYESTLDFWPGEYQEHFSYIVDRPNRDPAQDIVDSLRSGNSVAVQGQLISGDFVLKACTGRECATMGETLKVRRGEPVNIVLEMVDPRGKNNSPYNFPNPIHEQLGVKERLNKPSVWAVDLIRGVVGESFTPDDEEYFNPLAPETTRIATSWDKAQIDAARRGKGKQEIKLGTTMKFQKDSYIRARGSNVPAGTPNARDLEGNPLPDNFKDNIACNNVECPPHVFGVLTADVEAWADVWFYANPIFIEVGGRPEVKAEKEKEKKKNRKKKS